MKKSLLALLFIALAVPCRSQIRTQDISKYKVIDKSQLRVTYSLKFKHSSQNKSYYSDMRIVQVGSKIVKDFSRTMNQKDSIAMVLIKKGAQSLEYITLGTVYPYEIFNGYEKNRCLITYRTFTAGPVLRYFDEQPAFVWELKNETKDILGYKCQLATTRFAGRDYRAWFANELPVNGGPYKFNGLPGFILEVEEINRFFVWTATGISKVTEPIVEYEIKDGYYDCTAKHANELIKRMFHSSMAFDLSLNPNAEHYRLGKDGSLTKMKITDEKPIPYEPLEL